MEKIKLEQAAQLLVNNGYTVKGTTIKAPDTDNPLDAISIQDQLSDLGYRLQYIGNILKLVKAEI